MARRRRRRMTRKQARMRRRRIRIAGFCLAGCILILGIVCGAFHHYVSQFPEDKIAENIYVGTVDLSGLSKKEALEKLAGQKKADQKQTVSLTVEGQKAEATLEECGFDYADVKANVKAAMDYGKSGGLFGRYKSLRKLSKEKVVLSPEYTLDQKATENILEERAVPFAKHAQNATITKSGSGLQINKEEIGETVDKSGTIKAIKKHLNDSWDHGSFAMEAKVKEEQPSVTEADLSTIQDELGSFSTDAGGGERWKNLKNGVEKLNGTVVMPGEQISVHDVTAPYDEEHGYVQAGSYENGQVVDTYGGGICQVSTTLYNAVLFSELKVVKRYPHSMRCWCPMYRRQEMRQLPVTRKILCLKITMILRFTFLERLMTIISFVLQFTEKRQEIRQERLNLSRKRYRQKSRESSIKQMLNWRLERWK